MGTTTTAVDDGSATWRRQTFVSARQSRPTLTIGLCSCSLSALPLSSQRPLIDELELEIQSAKSERSLRLFAR